jgi:hypothetical protein
MAPQARLHELERARVGRLQPADPVDRCERDGEQEASRRAEREAGRGLLRGEERELPEDDDEQLAPFLGRLESSATTAWRWGIVRSLTSNGQERSPATQIAL